MLLSHVRPGISLLVDVLLHVAEMALHLKVRFLAVARGNGGGNRFVEGGIHRLALVAMRILAEAPPAQVALAGAHGVEEREKQRVSGRFGNGSMEQGIGSLVGLGIACRARFGSPGLETLCFGLRALSGRPAD